MLAEFVHHLVCGAQDFEIGQHNFLHSSLDSGAGVRDRLIGLAFEPEERPYASAGALAFCVIPTPAALCKTCRAAAQTPLTELERETIPSQTARP
jgi:hypothetical protein